MKKARIVRAFFIYNSRTLSLTDPIFGSETYRFPRTGRKTSFLQLPSARLVGILINKPKSL